VEELNMGHEFIVFLFTFGLFLGMLLFLEIGRRLGIRRRKQDAGVSGEGVGAVDGAVFALLGLLIAFTFSGASSRFDARRQLIVEETNDIGTAYLRLDLLPADLQPALRESFRRYLDARIEVYRKISEIAVGKESLSKESLVKANELQTQIWRQAVAASRAEGASHAAPLLLLPALNAMIDITTTRTMATQMHPPTVVFVMLFGLALAASLLAGFGMTGNKVRCWLHMLGFALAMAVAVYVILDIEYPRLGLIRVDAFDQALIDLRASMNRDTQSPAQK
jgi:hypothetical protein